MKKVLLALGVLSTIAILLMSCGNDTHTPPTPVVPSGNVVFLQRVPDASFAPMLGTFSGNQLTASRYKDPSTEEEVYGNFYSIILSSSNKKATFDLYGGAGDVSTEQWDVYVANIETNSLIQISNDTYEDGWPQFNPAGTQIIYSSDRPSTQYENYWQWMLVTKNADGTGNETIIPFGEGLLHAWSPAYSPDGTKIALEGWGYDQQDNWVDGIYIVNADGSNPVMLTNPSTDCDCYDDTPSFTSDGAKIVFSRDSYDAETDTWAEDIYIMNTDGTEQTKLSDGVGFNSDPLVLRDPATNTDKILFASNRDNLTLIPDGFEIYSMNLDGTAITRLTNNTMFDAFTCEFYDVNLSATTRRMKPRAGLHGIPRPYISGKTLNW